MQPIVFNKAGKIMLIKYENGLPAKLDPAKCFSRNGVVQQITPNININGSPIADGNSLWDAANLDTKIEGTIAVQLGYMPPELYAFIMGDTSETNQTVEFPYVDMEFTIPSTTPYTVKLPFTPTADGVMVVDIQNKVFTKDATAAAGKYSLTTDTLTFHADDKGKTIFVSGYASKTGATKFGLPKSPVRAAHQLIIVGEAVGEDETLYNVATTIDKCKVLGAINPPQQGGTPSPVTITFTVLKPRGNNRAVEYMAIPMV